MKKQISLYIALCIMPLWVGAQSDISHLYEDLVKNFAAKRLYEKFSSKDISKDSFSAWDSFLDTNEYYPITFSKIIDSSGVFRKNLILFRYSGFGKVHVRLNCSEVDDNLNIPYAIKKGTPFSGFEEFMDGGIVGVDSSKGEIVFISGALFINSKELLEEYVKPNFNRLDYISLRFFNYEPAQIKKVEDHYEFYSKKMAKQYKVWLDGENFEHIIEEK